MESGGRSREEQVESPRDAAALAAARRMGAECLCFRARRVSRLITRVYDEALRPLGLQATQLTLLNAITLCGTGGATMARLAGVLAMDATTLSRNLRPLASAGLVAVGRGAEDRRVRVARLTPVGARRVAEALPHWERAHARVVEALGAAQAAELKGRLDDVMAGARDGDEAWAAPGSLRGRRAARARWG